MARNGSGGFWIESGGNPTIAGCTVRGHTARNGWGFGIYVHQTAAGVAVGEDCVFAGNRIDIHRG